MKKHISPLDRRSFMRSIAVAGGALTVSIHLPACKTVSMSERSPNEVAPNAWLRIAPDKGVTFLLDKAEMGQGVITSLPILIAEELGVTPDSIHVEFAPAGPEFINRELDIQITGASNSLSSSFLPLREAASSTRLLLERAAARYWSITPQQVQTRDGLIVNTVSGASQPLPSFALLTKGLSLPKPRLKQAQDFVYIGKSQPRLDNDAKIHGKARFGIDVVLDGMLTAIVIRPPSFGAILKSFDTQKVAKGQLVQAFAIPQGLALVGTSYWSLRKAQADVTIEWTPGEHQEFSSEVFAKTLQKALQTDDGKSFGKGGPVDRNFQQATKKLDMEFVLPYLAHATLEPQNCTVWVEDDRCRIWAPTQGPELAQMIGMRITGLDRDQVSVETTFLGGGFGRRLNQDYVAEAVEISKVLKKPVKLIWSREDDTAYDFYRPMTAHRVRAALDDQLEISSWSHKIAGQSLTSSLVPEWLPAMAPSWLEGRITNSLARFTGRMIDRLSYDDLMTEGANPIGYRTRAEELRFEAIQAPVPIGLWRSVAHSYTAFVVESVIDQLAHIAGDDPLRFRQRLLRDQPRHLGVLNLAAEKAGWGSKKPPYYQGIAVHMSFFTYVAQIVDIEYTPETGARVLRVTCAVDCGLAVNPDTVRAQMEGGIIFALSQALYQSVAFHKGHAVPSNFDTYPMLRLQETPEIDVHIVPSTATPSGVGEPGVPPLVPALANALFRATGVRQTSNPLDLKPPTKA